MLGGRMMKESHPPSVRSLVVSVVLVLLFSTQAPSVHATITDVASGKRWNSKPDYKVGSRLWKGYEYVAHLQYVPNNLLLCPPAGETPPHPIWNVTRPSDGAPGKHRT